VEAATSLFQDVAVSVEENESFLRASFGAEALLAVITSLHGEVGAAYPLILSKHPCDCIWMVSDPTRHGILHALRFCACCCSAMRQVPRYCSGTPVCVSWRGCCRASTRTRAAQCFQRPQIPAPVRSAVQSLHHCILSAKAGQRAGQPCASGSSNWPTALRVQHCWHTGGGVPGGDAAAGAPGGGVQSVHAGQNDRGAGTGAAARRPPQRLQASLDCSGAMAWVVHRQP
jgi:hypothetical protein